MLLRSDIDFFGCAKGVFVALVLLSTGRMVWSHRFPCARVCMQPRTLRLLGLSLARINSAINLVCLIGHIRLPLTRVAVSKY